MLYDTKRQAVEAWVNEFNSIPQSIIEKLLHNDCDELVEITPPSCDDRVYVYDYDAEGTIIDITCDVFSVQLDDGRILELARSDFEVQYDGFLPMWGTMWAFGDSIDTEWVNGEYLGPHLREMADCGFRIYEQEDYGIIFGIDGCGYDFYESHWIPLYEKRGLKWDRETLKEDEENGRF